MKAAGNSKNRRRHLRFSLKGLNVSYLELKADGDEFKPDLVGLIADESLEGARLVFVHAGGIELQASYRVQVGTLPVIKAKVQWMKELDNGIKLVGVQYLDE